jgi:hypothetical protein
MRLTSVRAERHANDARLMAAAQPLGPEQFSKVW